MMGTAQDIMKALDDGEFDYERLIKATIIQSVDIILDEVDERSLVEMALYKYEDKIPDWVKYLAMFASNATIENSALDFVKVLLRKWIAEGELQKLIDKYFGQESDPVDPVDPNPNPDPNPVPVLLPKMRKFVPAGESKLLWQGHDNAPVTMAADGTLYTATGDGFWPIGGRNKYETCLFKLPNGKDPMNPGHWEFIRGTRGKCYGIVCVGNKLYLFQSDKGSGWEGMQDCRIWDVFADKRSETFQKHLAGDGANWFAVQKGPGYKNSYHADNIVDVGCVTFAGVGHGQHHANFKTPIKLWRGDIRNIKSFRRIGIADGINGPRNYWTTTMSIAYIPERKQYVSGGGDWTASQIYQSVSQNDSVIGPYTRKDIDDFKPPMTRDSYKDGTRWSGVFTSSYFCVRGQWYQMLSGHNPSGKLNRDDSVHIRTVKAVI